MRILTFDLEDWFHLAGAQGPGAEAWAEPRVEAMADRVLAVLSDTRQAATFFCLGAVADAHPALVRRIAAAGHEVGCHSHLHRTLAETGPAAFREDLRRALGILGDCAGSRVTAYRAPAFSLNRAAAWATGMLAEEGIEADASLFSVTWGTPGLGAMANAPFRIRANGGTLLEFPMNTWRFGPVRLRLTGGYFRALPYPALRRLLRRPGYAMTCFHPRDFDADMPRHHGLGALRSAKLRLGLSGALEKLRRMLLEFRFLSLRAASGIVDWDRTPVLPL
ncbi:MAG: DUF3473 domain-containing protein [Lentisphaerae bacterium]|nr:DUF3473 domain-containing protein [Lentisphaerota bacterium]